MEIGDVVVHKSNPSINLVVIGFNDNNTVSVRYANQTKYEGTSFSEFHFKAAELETPIESIDREAELFKAVTARQRQINEEMGNSKPGPVGLKHLN